MAKWFEKDKDAKLDYKIDWSTWLDGDTITVSAWTVPEGITEEAETTNDTTSATIWLSGGTADTDYTLVNHITTASGREDDETIVISVIDNT